MTSQSEAISSDYDTEHSSVDPQLEVHLNLPTPIAKPRKVEFV